MAKKASKNQMAGQRGDARKKFYEGDRDCLRCYNYSNGAGWKSSKKWEKKISFAIKRKKNK